MSTTNTSNTSPSTVDDVENTRDQRKVRQAKRQELLDAGVAAYPVEVDRTHTLAEIREKYPDLEPGVETGDIVSVAGRVVFQRNTGKLCFASLQEGGAAGEHPRLQVMLSQARVGADSLDSYKHLVDLGDHISVTGEVITSKRGELSIMADSWTMASKALRPLPVLHADLAEETRVRQRYADLIVRQEAAEMVHKRAGVVRAIRRTLEDQGYIEVETPILQLIHGGAQARPFETHLNAFDQTMTLRIATELYLKRAVVGGIDKIFEIGRVFRNEGVDSTHSPEFTMLEAYEAYSDMYGMAERIREVILAAAKAAGVEQELTTPEGNTIVLDTEWEWREFYPAVSEAVGQEVTPDTTAEELLAIAKAQNIDVDASKHNDAQELALELFDELVEPNLVQPTFVYHYPQAAQPLARPHRQDPRMVEAWDLIIDGYEIGTAFSELIDPVIQRERLTSQSEAAAAGDEEAMQLDHDFLRALEYGAPPTGGLGMGVDRLVMLLTGTGIRETILFPLLKPEEGNE
ncbi:lysine--tRNA ligase [Enteractinococcus fodinae]|uniref:Lysine--tRNA ligase n=1 Tax=Enteractinococcus fodinae TaxID=684663 RepID=A0ABU2B3E4_9MICC|nr:lysine--tRNA ligase [Enteractinococcus fodinae]MDR7348115.1 lysyl-tRNA synthetase class 2 [Enteractinococcus fodinae]